MRVALVLLLTGCRQLFGIDDPRLARDAATVVDAPADTSVPLGPWVEVGVAFPDTALVDDDPTATGDVLEMYFNRGNEIFRSTRANRGDGWSDPFVVTELSTGSFETTPEITPNGLTIFLASDRSGTLGVADLMVATRRDRASAWDPPTFVTELNTTESEAAGGPTADLLEIAFTRTPTGQDGDMFVATRTSIDSAFPDPRALDDLNSPANDFSPCFSADGLTLLFDSDRAGNHALYIATRPSRDLPFGSPAVILELDTDDIEEDAWMSPDGRSLLFVRNVGGVRTIFEAAR